MLGLPLVNLMAWVQPLAVRIGSVVVVAGLVLGCANTPKTDMATPQQALVPATTPVPTATAAKAFYGRIRVQWVDASTPPLQANFVLEGNNTEGQIQLETPFGAALAAVGWHPNGAWLSKDGAVSQYSNRDSLFLAVLGSDLPVDALLDWLGGLGSARLSQSGWTIEDNQPARRLQALRLLPSPSVRITIALDGSP